MSFGKLYTFKGNSRSTALLAVAKENKLDLEVVHTEPQKGVSAEYLKLNKLGRVPTFQGSDDFVLTECIAIAVYLTSQNEKTTLLGQTKQDYASILKWMSFANSEILPNLGGWFRPIVGRDPYNKKNVDDAQKRTLEAIKVLEDHFLYNSYFVGERVTLADLFAVGIVSRGFQYFFDKKWRADYPCFTRWYTTMVNKDILKDIVGKVEFIDEAIKYTPPKKEPAPKKEQPKPKPKAAEPEDEDEAPPAPKPKHELELLPRAKFDLNEWKRQYSNKETREEALPWLWSEEQSSVWKNEFSLWRVDFKYGADQTKIFMSANLIGGFFNRMEASRNYMFGSMSVYALTGSEEKGDSELCGAFMVRGDKWEPAFTVGPDWESYEYTKLDVNNPKDQEFINDVWAWDKPIEINGKSYEWKDGKIYK